VTTAGEDVFMKTPSSDRTGILIVRLWLEGNARDGFRARITQTLDSAGPEQAMATAANPEDVYAVVKTWVETFVNPN
jgi:antitoxin component HigA of HigAB toxin-antitoxin module